MVTVPFDSINFGRTWCVVNKHSLGELKIEAVARVGLHLDSNWEEYQDLHDVILKRSMMQKTGVPMGGAAPPVELELGDWVNTTWNIKGIRGDTEVIAQVIPHRKPDAQGKPVLVRMDGRGRGWFMIRIEKQYNPILQRKQFRRQPDVKDLQKSVGSLSHYDLLDPSEIPVGAGDILGTGGGTHHPQAGLAESINRERGRTDDMLHLFVHIAKDLQRFEEAGHEISSISFDLSGNKSDNFYNLLD